MKTNRLKSMMGFGLLSGLAVLAVASTPSPFQPTDTPLGLSIIAPTQLAASDTTSASFQTYANGYVSYIRQKLPEGVAFTGAGLNQLDPKRLYFLFDYAPRVYYIYEGACYDNAVGATIATLSAPSNSILTGNTFTIFPWVHSSLGSACASGSGVRSAAEPLLPGDWVQLPTVKAGQQLAFFLMAEMYTQVSNGNGNGNGYGYGNGNGNGNNQQITSYIPSDVYYNGANLNPDNFQHMIAFFPDQSQYIIIGFEDMYNGGDQDCNDAMFVIDVGPQNALVLRNPSSLPK